MKISDSSNKRKRNDRYEDSLYKRISPVPTAQLSKEALSPRKKPQKLFRNNLTSKVVLSLQILRKFKDIITLININ